MQRIKIIAIVANLAFWTACTSVPVRGASACPAAPQYSTERWQKIESAITELSDSNALIPVLQDYMDVLEKLELCAQLKREPTEN